MRPMTFKPSCSLPTCQSVRHRAQLELLDVEAKEGECEVKCGELDVGVQNSYSCARVWVMCYALPKE